MNYRIDNNKFLGFYKCFYYSFTEQCLLTLFIRGENTLFTQ